MHRCVFAERLYVELQQNSLVKNHFPKTQYSKLRTSKYLPKGGLQNLKQPVKILRGKTLIKDI